MGATLHQVVSLFRFFQGFRFVLEPQRLHPPHIPFGVSQDTPKGLLWHPRHLGMGLILLASISLAES